LSSLTNIIILHLDPTDHVKYIEITIVPPMVISYIRYKKQSQNSLRFMAGTSVKTHSKQLKEAAYNKTDERKTPRKQSLHAKTAASVILKLFISGNE